MKRCLKCQKVFKENGWRCAICGWHPVEEGRITVFASVLPNYQVSYPPNAYARLFELESNSFWFRNRNRLILRMLARYFPDASSLLEIGCGTGFILEGIATANPNLHLVGSDLHYEALSYAKTRLPAASLLQMEAGNIPYVEEFDVIGLFDVLEHISDDKTAIRQIHRALKPEGGLMLTVPQHAWLWSRADDEARHLRRYGRHDLLNTLEDSGFRIIQVTSFISLLLPLLIISRLLSRSETARKSSNPQWKELHLPGPIDRIFETICSWEQVLIDRKLSFPVGGSLLCIALKR